MILIIGSGKISTKFQKYLNDKKLSFKNYTFENFSKLNFKSLELEKYNSIFFLGYNHNSLILNILIFRKFINYLKKKKYKGKFIFFNTQVLLNKNITKNKLKWYENDTLNRYYLCKKFQLNILVNSNLNYFNLYLPIVCNISSIQENILKDISNFEIVSLPNKGKNYLYFLDIENLLKALIKINNNNFDETKKNLYLFSKYITLIEYLKREKNFNIKTVLENQYPNQYNLKKLTYFSYLLINLIKNIIMLFNFKKNNNRNQNLNLRIKTKNFILPPLINKLLWFDYLKIQKYKDIAFIDTDNDL